MASGVNDAGLRSEVDMLFTRVQALTDMAKIQMNNYFLDDIRKLYADIMTIR